MRDLEPDVTVGELVQGLLVHPGMSLPRIDPAGAPITYEARLEREGRRLLPSERIGETLREGDRVQLNPDVTAGSR